MDTREIAKEYRLAHWAQVLKERTGSGLSIREYCKNVGIEECVFYYWQRKLQEAACREFGTKAENESERAVAPVAPKGWMVCETKGKEPSAALTIEIGPYRIIVETGVDSETLATVCRALSSLC